MNCFPDTQFLEGESHQQNKDLYQNDLNNVQENNNCENDSSNIYESRKSEVSIMNNEFNKIIIYSSENKKGEFYQFHSDGSIEGREVIQAEAKSFSLMDDADKKKPIVIEFYSMFRKIVRKRMPGGSINNPIEIDD